VTRGAASENRPVAPANNVGALFNVQALISPLPYTTRAVYCSFGLDDQRELQSQWQEY
jgi:hypothetical protein